MTDAEREAILAEIRKKKVVYTLPGMDALEVRRELTYRSTAGNDLAFEIFYPERPPGTRVTVVILVMGYPDPEAGIRQFGPFTSWARLVAASGMAAVLYGSVAPAQDTRVLIGHLRANADGLGIDAGRIGVFSMSGSVPVALAMLMHDHTLRCAALVCGYTMDLDGGTAVADMGKEAGFVDACAGKSVDDLPDGTPMLFVRAGREHGPGLNDALDKVVTRALARNLPITLVNHATGTHGFVVDEDNELSRGIIRQVLAFLRLHLAGVG